MRIAAIFDVDGTLTATTGVDDECFVRAVEGVLGVRVTDTDWGNYVHSTDEGLTAEIGERGLGRRVRADEAAEVKRVFVGLLKERIGNEPWRCRGVEGVMEMLEAVRGRARREEWDVGIASGAWPESAAVKLGFAGVRVDDLASTFSHAHASGDAATREQIIAGTIEKLGTAESTRVVYIGDGVWDARAARNLGIGFVGVRCDGKRERLEREGAARIVQDYRDVAGILGMIEEAGRGCGGGEVSR